MTARLTRLLAVLAAAGALLPASAAAATPANVKRVVGDYRDDGKLDPCKHSVDDLRDTLEEITADTQQYAPDFPAAVEAAIEAHARGECDPESKAGADSGGAASGTTSTPAPPAATPAPPAATPVPGAPAQEVVPEPPAPPPAATAVPPAGDAAGTVVSRGTAARDDGFTTVPLIVLAALLVAALLTGLLLLAAQRFGWGEERLAGARHALAEAGYRTGGTWQDFTDWLRLGR